MNKTGKTVVITAPNSVKWMSKIFLRHKLIKKTFLTFLFLTTYLYTFSLYYCHSLTRGTHIRPILRVCVCEGCLIDWLVFNANHSINQPLHTQTLFRMGRMWVPRVIAGGGHRHEQIDIHIIYIYKHNILFRYPANFRYYDI